MNRTIEYRLRVGRGGHVRLAALVESQRLLYNAALQERRDAWRLAGKTITLYDQQRSMTECRRDLADMAAMPVALQRGTLRRVDRAYRAFFRRCKADSKPGFPRFKGLGRFHTLEWDEYKGIRFDTGTGRLTSKAFGTLRARVHRPFPEGVSIKAVRIVRDVKGWKVQLAVLLAAPAKRAVRTAAGLDFGLTHLATVSDGGRIANPRAGRAAAAVLRRRQRHLARCRRGSKGRRRARAAVQRAHSKAAYVRRTWHRQQAARLFELFDLVAMEDLNVRGWRGGGWRSRSTMRRGGSSRGRSRARLRVPARRWSLLTRAARHGIARSAGIPCRRRSMSDGIGAGAGRRWTATKTRQGTFCTGP